MMKEGIVQMICSNMKDMLKNLPRDMNCDKVSDDYVPTCLVHTSSLKSFFYSGKKIIFVYTFRNVCELAS